MGDYLTRRLEAKLLLPLVIMLAVLAAVMVVQLVAERRLSSQEARIERASDEIHMASEMRSLSRAEQRDTLVMIFDPDPDYVATTAVKFDKRMAKLADHSVAVAGSFDAAEARRFGRIPALQAAVNQELKAIRSSLDTASRDERFAAFRTRLRPAEKAASALVDAYIDHKGAQIAALKAEREAVRAELGLLRWISAIVGVLVAVAACIYVVRRWVSRPLEALTGCMAELSRGNLDVVIPDDRRRDEVGVMTEAVRVFLDGARSKVALEAEQARLESERLEAERRASEQEAALQAQRLRQQEQELAAAREREVRAQRLEGYILGFEQQVAAALRTLTESGVRLEASAGVLGSSAAVTSDRAMAASASAQQTTVNVQLVASATEELSASISEISRQLASSQQVTSQAVEQAGASDSRMEALTAVANQVGDIVTLIQNIAEQTNLLALNATIEAARAGDAGRGFAVVANEVKVLAGQTASATTEIADKIGAMQSETARAAEAIRQVVETIRDMTGIFSAIAAAIEQQHAATRDIAQNVQQAAQGTQVVADSMDHMTGAAQETAQVANDVSTASAALNGQTGQLRVDVDRFLADVRAA